MRTATPLLLLTMLFVLGCAPHPAVTLWVWLEAEPGLDLGEVQVKPASALAERHEQGGRLLLGLAAPSRVTLEAPFACPIDVEPAPTPGTVVRHRLRALFAAGPRVRVLGFDEPLEIRAEPACPSAADASATLAVIGGEPLGSVAVADGGRALGLRTLPPGSLAPHVGHGIVPIAAGEVGRTAIELMIRLRDGRTHRSTLEVTATSRASGLGNVAVTHPVLLRGDELRLSEVPDGSRADLRAVGSLFELVPDVTGRFVVEDGRGRRTVIESGAYDQTPLDCGRAGCHGTIARSAASSPMTHAYARDLDGPRALADPGCALRCHTTGEPGTRDGGFQQVKDELDLAPPHAFSDLPRALRRLGGVGCLACHGPSAIPDQSSRFALLGRGVCAVCHDAPPSYGHVRALEASRMATADHDPRTRAAPCARCHTTFGALGRDSHRPPDDTTLGLGCATCHDVHPHETERSSTSGVRPSLLRALPVPAALGALPEGLAGASRVCLNCHAPADAEGPPEASAAALMLGRGGVDPKTGEALSGTAPHASASQGCLSCHAEGPEGLGRGANHAFAAGTAACAACHAAPPARDRTLAARARDLAERLGAPRQTPRNGEPPHATGAARPPDVALGRALRDVKLVLEDPAADVHNPSYARMLLAAAEAALSAGGAAPAHAP